MNQKPKIRLDVDRALDAYERKTGKRPTQAEFCSSVGITPMTLDNYRKGKTPDVLRLVAQLMEETGLAYTQLVIVEPSKSK